MPLICKFRSVNHEADVEALMAMQEAADKVSDIHVEGDEVHFTFDGKERNDLSPLSHEISNKLRKVLMCYIPPNQQNPLERLQADGVFG
ncbi:MAG: hypothetical protein K9M03_03990 [Kiritimatiellales bacterium]|nr:hypothetical protein [Kiritimatiellales bacterium]